MKKKWITYWCIFFGTTAIAIGALGAHTLRDYLEPEKLNSLQTGVRYQLFHVVGILAIGLSQYAERLKWSLRLFIAGILLFSFSIYALVLFPLAEVDVSFLGPITPLGGLTLMAGWIALIPMASKSIKS